MESCNFGHLPNIEAPVMSHIKFCDCQPSVEKYCSQKTGKVLAKLCWTINMVMDTYEGVGIGKYEGLEQFIFKLSAR